MTWRAPDVNRTDPPYVGDERSQLDAWLDFQRDTLLVKCAGLTADQVRTPSVEPSSLTLLGLVRHMAEVERWWFRRNFAGADVGPLYCFPENEDADFDDLSGDPAADFAAYAEEVALARAAAAGRDLDETFTHPRRGAVMSLRWVYLHMIEEYARHNGHADLLRERIDGVTGD